MGTPRERSIQRHGEPKVIAEHVKCIQIIRSMFDPLGNCECYHGFSPPSACRNEQCNEKTAYLIIERIIEEFEEKKKEVV